MARQALRRLPWPGRRCLLSGGQVSRQGRLAPVQVRGPRAPAGARRVSGRRHVRVPDHAAPGTPNVQVHLRESRRRPRRTATWRPSHHEAPGSGTRKREPGRRCLHHDWRRAPHRVAPQPYPPQRSWLILTDRDIPQAGVGRCSARRCRSRPACRACSRSATPPRLGQAPSPGRLVKDLSLLARFIDT